MSRHSTAEEVRREHIEILGNNLGSVFHELWNELALLYMKWEEYVELFGKTPSRTDLLNQAAPVFFKVVQDTLWENILLHIARLTDPPKSAGKNNLTIQCLPLLVAKEIGERISEQVTIAKDKTHFCRDWRNRRIAHSDLKLAMGDHAEPLNPASRAQVKDALESISKVLNIITEYYNNSTIGFDSIIMHGGAVDLLYVIDDGIRADIKRQSRIKAGKYLPDDLADRDL